MTKKKIKPKKKNKYSAALMTGMKKQVDKPWKERIVSRRNQELTKRGIVIPKNDIENAEFLKAAENRGGIVFVSEEAKKELNGTDVQPI